MRNLKLVVGIAVGLLLFLSTITPALPEKIIWASTQLVPAHERAFVIGELLPPFKEETGIEVEFVGLEYAELADRLEAEQLARKVTIGVIGELHGGLDLFASKEFLEDLAKLPKLPERTFIPTLERFSYLYGIKAYVPWMQATYVMVVNKKAFKYLPEGLTPDDVIKGTYKWTYTALLEWAKKLKEETGTPQLGFPVAPKGLWHRFLHGYLYPAFTGAQVKNFDSPEAVEMWSYLKELWEYVHPASTTWASMAEPLLREEVLLAWDHTARIKDAIVQRPEDFVVVPVPVGPKGRGFILVVAGLAIPKGAPDIDASWKLIEYLTRPEVQTLVLEKVGFFPTVKEAAGKVPAGALRILAEGVTTQTGAPYALVAMIPSLGPLSGEFTALYREAFERIILKGEDIGSVIADVGPRIMKLFEEVGAPLPPPDAGS
ncbi:MAG: carbohydrate ABC transporter substrate-binding protein [Thermoprotei archaeon]|nr:MAG: carbohydrate ABC transporter substrate-binding protein [Thermoprotei archaeon]